MTHFLFIAAATALGRAIFHLLHRRPPPSIVPLHDVVAYYDRLPIAQLTEPQCAQVVGALSPRGEVPSPLARRPCLWWRVTIEQLVGATWQRCVTYQLGGNMKLSDATGTCLLDPSEAVLELDTTTRTIGRVKELRPEQARALAGLGFDTWHLPRRAKLRISETTLGSSQRISVAGVVQIAERSDGERDYRSRPPSWPVFAGEILIASVAQR